ncbi:WD40 repeat-like protein [Calocera cornea HHB12733]|uniref:WD40 repeat-like protein n=1 Tax=Calocera cornea HHB12733 TaxID=1353952 RepID=A0A165EVE1_9BASI|nr:WD40 repeat-like protein [Calocera cornea HHB12733]
MAPSTEPVVIETAHEDMIHDAQLDYYGKRLATCSSDRTIKIFDVVDGEPQKQGEILQGHTGPVWQVAWAHPKYGNILASCSYDGRVFVWKYQPSPPQPSAYGVPGASTSHWTRIKEHSLHTASVNSVSWAPHELGPILACASSDGRLSVLTFKNDGTADADIFSAHPIGCNAVSWAPATVPGSLTSGAPAGQLQQYVRRFASAGCDNLVRIWTSNDANTAWKEEAKLEGHTDWVRDVAWAPNIGLPRQYIATASQDRTVLIWTQDTPQSPWNKVALDPTGAGTPAADASPNKFPDVVWRVSWSLAGNILAVSCGDGKVSLWKENLKGAWECVSDMAS